MCINVCWNIALRVSNIAHRLGNERSQSAASRNVPQAPALQSINCKLFFFSHSHYPPYYFCLQLVYATSCPSSVYFLSVVWVVDSHTRIHASSAVGFKRYYRTGTAFQARHATVNGKLAPVLSSSTKAVHMAAKTQYRAHARRTRGRWSTQEETHDSGRRIKFTEPSGHVYAHQ